MRPNRTSKTRYWLIWPSWNTQDKLLSWQRQSAEQCARDKDRKARLPGPVLSILVATIRHLKVLSMTDELKDRWCHFIKTGFNGILSQVTAASLVASLHSATYAENTCPPSSEAQPWNSVMSRAVKTPQCVRYKCCESPVCTTVQIEDKTTARKLLNKQRPKWRCDFYHFWEPQLLRH